MKKLLIVAVVATSFLSSCGTGWESGGKEDFKKYCMRRSKHLTETRNLDEALVSDICDCMVEKAVIEYPSYQDARENKNDFMVNFIDSCL